MSKLRVALVQVAAFENAWGGLYDMKDEDWRAYGEWPKVLACDWCGKFVPRKKRADKYASLTVPEGLDVKKTEDGHACTFKRS